MPKKLARAISLGPWPPRARCISARETNAWTAPDSPKPSTSAHSVSQNMKNASRRLAPARPRACRITSCPSTRQAQTEGARRPGADQRQTATEHQDAHADKDDTARWRYQVGVPLERVEQPAPAGHGQPNQHEW